MGERLIKVVEFATMAGVAPSTIYKMVEKTRDNTAKIRIKFVEQRRGLSSMILIPESELDKFKPVVHEG